MPGTNGASVTNVVPSGTVGQGALGQPAVDTVNLFNLAVTLGKMAANSVDASKIIDGSVGTAELGPLAVTLAKLAADSVDSSKIVDGSVGLAELAANSVDSSKIVDGSIVNADVNAAAGITSGKLAGYGAYPLSHTTISNGVTTTISITGIPQTYRHLLLVLGEIRSANASAGGDYVMMRLNNDSSAVYNESYAFLQATYTGVVNGAQTRARVMQCPAAGDNAGVYTSAWALIGDYTNASLVGKSFSGQGGGFVNTIGMFPFITAGLWGPGAAAAITRIDLFLFSGAAFAGSGKVDLYGLE